MERRERASIARSGGAELHGHAAGFLNKASGRAVFTDMMSTRVRLGIAAAGGLAAILAAAWFRSATQREVASPVAGVAGPAVAEDRLSIPAPGPDGPTHFNYDLAAWHRLLPEPRVVLGAGPVEVWKPSAVESGTEGSEKPASESVAVDPWNRGAEVATAWVQEDRNRGYRGPWHHFLENWVDPLVVESDGVSFYDPSEYPVKSLLPVKLPKAYGFGIKFRASF